MQTWEAASRRTENKRYVWRDRQVTLMLMSTLYSYAMADPWRLDWVSVYRSVLRHRSPVVERTQMELRASSTDIQVECRHRTRKIYKNETRIFRSSHVSFIGIGIADQYYALYQAKNPLLHLPPHPMNIGGCLAPDNVIAELCVQRSVSCSCATTSNGILQRTICSVFLWRVVR